MCRMNHIDDWLIAGLKRWKEEGGLDYFFTDFISSLERAFCQKELKDPVGRVEYLIEMEQICLTPTHSYGRN